MGTRARPDEYGNYQTTTQTIHGAHVRVDLVTDMAGCRGEFEAFGRSEVKIDQEPGGVTCYAELRLDRDTLVALGRWCARMLDLDRVGRGELDLDD